MYIHHFWSFLLDNPTTPRPGNQIHTPLLQRCGVGRPQGWKDEVYQVDIDIMWLSRLGGFKHLTILLVFNLVSKKSHWLKHLLFFSPNLGVQWFLIWLFLVDFSNHWIHLFESLDRWKVKVYEPVDLIWWTVQRKVHLCPPLLSNTKGPQNGWWFIMVPNQTLLKCMIWGKKPYFWKHPHVSTLPFFWFVFVSVEKKLFQHRPPDIINQFFVFST